jgi:hypothetical protein
VTSEDFEEGYRAVVKRPECGAYYELSYGSWDFLSSLCLQSAS